MSWREPDRLHLRVDDELDYDVPYWHSESGPGRWVLARVLGYRTFARLTDAPSDAACFKFDLLFGGSEFVRPDLRYGPRGPARRRVRRPGGKP
jgi:hypothetical protein